MKVMGSYAGFWRRLLAYLIDTSVIGSLLMVFSNGNELLNPTGTLYQVVSFVTVGVYLILFWAFQGGQTLGNRVLKISVVNEDLSKMTFGTAILRFFGFIISSFIFGIGFLWVAFDKKKQGIHDKIARTVVVSNGKPKVLVVVLVFVVSFAMYAVFLANLFMNVWRSSENTLIDQQVAPRFSDQAFTQANEIRTSKGLPALNLDNRLCAYAQRRLEQLSDLGKYDDGKGFYEDTASIEIHNAYFTENPTVGELSRQLTLALSNSEGIRSIVEAWATEGSNLLNKDFVNGCVRMDSSFIIFILGGAK